jgi:hypothetical protein
MSETKKKLKKIRVFETWRGREDVMRKRKCLVVQCRERGWQVKGNSAVLCKTREHDV